MNVSYFPSPKKDISNMIEEYGEEIEPTEAVLNKVATRFSPKKSVNIFDNIFKSSQKSPQKTIHKSPKRRRSKSPKRRKSSRKRSSLKRRKSRKN